MPDMNADCPMAHMADKDEILALREKYDDLAVVCYINSTAELKKYSDVCVTSSNAVKIVKNLPNKNIFFIPEIWEAMLRSNVQIRILYLIMAAAQDTLSLLKIWC